MNEWKNNLCYIFNICWIFEGISLRHEPRTCHNWLDPIFEEYLWEPIAIYFWLGQESVHLIKRMSQLIGFWRHTTETHQLNSAVSLCVGRCPRYTFIVPSSTQSSCYQSLSLAAIKSYQFNGNTHLKQRETQIKKRMCPDVRISTSGVSPFIT